MNWNYLKIILAFVLIGVGLPVAKDAAAIVPVWAFLAISLFVGWVGLVPVTAYCDTVDRRALGFKTWRAVFIQAALAAILYTAFTVYGLEVSNVAAAGVITSITPVVVALLSRFFLSEKLTRRKVTAIVTAVCGVILINFSQLGDSTSNSLLGAVYLLLAVLAISVFFITVKRFTVDLPPAAMATSFLFSALILSLPLAIAQSLVFDWSSIGKSEWLEMLFYGVFVWSLPTWLTYLAAPHISASTMGMSTAATPFAAVVTSVLFYNDKLTTLEAVALGFVVLSIFLAESNVATTAEQLLPIDS